MPLPATRAKALLQQLDQLIEKHGQDNSELGSDLRAYKAQLQDAERRRDARDFAMLALRVVALIKFFYDHWPG
jgi:hypothetical protein